MTKKRSRDSVADIAVAAAIRVVAIITRTAGGRLRQNEAFAREVNPDNRMLGVAEPGAGAIEAEVFGRIPSSYLRRPATYTLHGGQR